MYGTLLAVGLIVGGGVYLAFYHRPAPAEILLRGTSTEMGKTHGHAVRHGLRWIVKLYLRKGVCGGNAQLIEAREDLAAKKLDLLPVEYREEIAAISDGSGLELGAVAYGNMFLDLGNATVGCRSLVARTESGLRHCHNLDWDNLGGMARWTVTILRREPDDGRYRTVAIGFPGMVGALDIINEKGIALSFNQLGFGTEMSGEPVFITLRRIAEYCADFDAARVEILAMPPGLPFIITLSDAANARASIFERTRTHTGERPLAGGWIAAANLAQATHGIRTHVDEAFAAAPLDSVCDLRSALANPEVMMDCNLYSVVFDYRANCFYLASGTIPAAEGRSRQYDLV